MDAPDITCVIPTYNDRANLRRAVDSALNQTGVRVQVILVDDYSDQQTRQYLTSLGDADPRIRVFLLPANRGQGEARNVGAALAQSPYITFLDQDDQHASGWYRCAIDRLSSCPTLGTVSGQAQFVNIPERLRIDASDVRLQGLSFVFITNIVFRRSIFMASGGFPTSQVWRSPVAGEDGVYRESLARDWSGEQSERPALIHQLKEGGATVFYLDRSEVRDGKVVISRLHEIESSGALSTAHDEFIRKGRQTSAELRASLFRKD